MKTYKMDMTDLVKKYNPERVAEIGVMAGKVSHYLLSRIPSIEKLYMIDPWIEYRKIEQQESKDKRLVSYDQVYWDDMYRRAIEVAGRHGNRAEIVRKTSVEAAKDFKDGEFDVVVIDADHTYRSVIIDTATWLPKIKDNGIFVSHDYSGGWQDVVDATGDIFDDNFGRLNHSYIFVELNSELKVKYIKKAKELMG